MRWRDCEASADKRRRVRGGDGERGEKTCSRSDVGRGWKRQRHKAECEQQEKGKQQRSAGMTKAKRYQATAAAAQQFPERLREELLPSMHGRVVSRHDDVKPQSPRAMQL